MIQKCELHERNPCAPRFEERTEDETLQQERCARKVAWHLAKSVYKLKNVDKGTFFSRIEIKGNAGAHFKIPEEREFLVDSGALMQVLSNKDLSSEEVETLRRPRIPTSMLTANGEVQTNEEAQVFVHDIDIFVTVQVLDHTPAVLSLGKHGYSYEPAVKNHGLTKLSPSSGTSSSSASTPQDLSSTSSSAAAEQRDEPAPGNWSDSPKIQNPK